jgi:uncharacterized protein with HEPN domain
MSRPALERLKDIIHSTDLALQHAAPPAEQRGRDATIYRIVVIGEAVGHLPIEVQALAPDIPWSRIKDMRNHLVHAYWQVDLDVVDQTAASDLKPLAEAPARLIELLERAGP